MELRIERQGIVRLIAHGFFRVGSEKYQKENNTFGITTMRKSHVTVVGDAVEFEEGHVTMASPIGRALLGKAVGETTQLRLPTVVRTLKIVELKTIHDAAPTDL